METQLFTMRPLDLRNASDHEYACLHHFTMQLQGEAFPEDPPTALTEAIIGWRSIPANITPGAWVVWDADGNQIIAFGEAYLLSTDPDQADFRIGVLPAYRRRGVAHQLLAPIVDFTEQQGRIRLGTDTNDRVPTGAVFLERMGGQARFWAHFNQLHLADLNYKLLEQWLEAARQLEQRITLEFWTGPCPDERLVEFAALLEVIFKDIPHDDLEIVDMRFPPEVVHAQELARLADGTQRWALAAIDRASGALIGLTELFWHPNRPNMMQQDFTGVLPTYRKQGLGRWLKAAMIAHVLRMRPEVAIIRTFNANSNVLMMSINRALGFRPYLAQTTWQVNTATIRHYLART